MREIYIDSRKRKEPFGNSYTMFIQQPIKNITSVDLVSATIPNTIYNITNGSNIFSLNGNLFSIPNGFYSTCGLSKTINSLNSGVSMSLMDNEGRFMIASKTPFIFSILSNELLNISGFNSGTLYSNIATKSNGVYDASLLGTSFIKSSNVVNMKTGEYVFLDIEELRRPFCLEGVNDPYKADSSNRFAVIPLDVQSGSIKTFKEQSDYKIRVEYPKAIDSIDRLTIKWLDSQGKIVNFNGVDENQIILRFYTTIQKEQDDKKEKTEKILKKSITIHTLFLFLVIIFVILSFYKNK